MQTSFEINLPTFNFKKKKKKKNTHTDQVSFSSENNGESECETVQLRNAISSELCDFFCPKRLDEHHIFG